MAVDRNYKTCDPQLYTYLFNTDAGQKVLEDLTARFYHIQSFVQDNPHMTSFNEGQRFVLGFIQNRIAQGEHEPHSQQGE